MIPIISIRNRIPDIHTLASHDVNEYVNHVKNKMLIDLSVQLRPKVQFREFQDPQSYDRCVEASVVAMSYQEFQANYGTHQHRLGISDGTMAIMQNGRWKVLGMKPIPKQVEAPAPKKLTAVDYLTEKMRNS